MEFLICDTNRLEIGYLPDGATVDIEVGATKDSTNDAQLTCRRADGIRNGMWLICPGTEYGAPLEEIKSDSQNTDVTWLGDTVRGFLSQIIIRPTGNYRIVSGDANRIIAQIVGEAFDSLFSFPTADAGIYVNSYQFARYTDALTGLTSMLETVDARLNLEIIQGGANEPFTVEVSAVPVANWSSDVEYSQDSQTSMTMDDKKRGITHLICLGQGELSERTVVDLYLQADGSVARDKPYYTGFYERTDTYDYSNAEDEDALIEGGIERLLSEAPSLTADIDTDEDHPIGDIIAARDYENDLYIERPIVRKIVKVDKGIVTIETKTEGS